MAEKKLKLIQWLLYALMAVSALLTIIFYMNPSSPDIILYWGYALVIFAIAVILIVSISSMLKNPKSSYKALVVVAGMILLAIITYALSKNTLTPNELEKYSISANGVKWVGAGLLTTYIIGIIAIGVFVYTSIYRILK